MQQGGARHACGTAVRVRIPVVVEVVTAVAAAFPVMVTISPSIIFKAIVTISVSVPLAIHVPFPACHMRPGRRETRGGGGRAAARCTFKKPCVYEHAQRVHAAGKQTFVRAHTHTANIRCTHTNWGPHART
jgi:hypothetical protein